MTATAPAAGPGPVAAALDGLHQLPQWLAAAADDRAVAAALVRAVPRLSNGALRLVDLRTDRIRLKPTGWRVRYHVVVRDASGERRVALTGGLQPPVAGPRPPRSTTPRSRGRFPEPGWSGLLPGIGVRLGVEAEDRALPALPQLSDPTAARELLQRTLADHFRGIRIDTCHPDVVRYKPGSRCTVRYRLDYPPGADARWPRTVVAKTHQGDKGRNAYLGMRALWATGLAAGEVVSLAQPLGYLPQPRVLLQGPVAEERTLKEAVRAAVADGGAAAVGAVRARLRQTADGLVALHGSGVRHGPTETWWDELDEVRALVARLAATLPAVPAAVEPLLAWLAREAARVPPDPVVCVHHDFRPAQVLLAGGRIGFIDFDGFCMAEPALDVGRFRAKLRDIGMSTPGTTPAGGAAVQRLRLLDDLCDTFLERYQQQASVSAPRVVLWETLDLLTGLLHAWSKVRLARTGPRLAVLRDRLLAGGDYLPRPTGLAPPARK